MATPPPESYLHRTPFQPLHDRLPYLAPHERAPVRWPDGSRVALWVVPNVEHYEFIPPRSARDPYPRTPHPDVRRYGYHDYGNRVGFWRMLESLDRWEVPATVSLNVAVLQHEPRVAEAMASRPWEFMSHGLYNTRELTGLGRDEERALLVRCDELLEHATGRRFAGMLGPYISGNTWTPDLMAEHGMLYHADWIHDDLPAPLITDRPSRLVAIPYSYELNDAPLLMRSAIESDTYVELVVDHLRQLLDEPGDQARMACLPLHPFAIGQPHRIDALDRILAFVRESGGIWVATATDIVSTYLDQAETADRTRATAGAP